MTRCCIIGLFAFLLVATPAWPAALDGSADRPACNQGDIAACTRTINDPLADAHDRIAASFNRGLLHRDRGDRESALADFQQAISLDPESSNASLSNRCLAIAKSDDKDRPVFGYALADSEPPAQGEAVFRCQWQAMRTALGARCAVAETTCDGLAGLPAVLRPGQGRSCVIGEKVTVSGTIQDVARQWRGWSAGAIAQADRCRGLTDLSTGFAALFGDGRPPPHCEHGSRFWATGTASSGFQPEFFLKVESITCE